MSSQIRKIHRVAVWGDSVLKGIVDNPVTNHYEICTRNCISELSSALNIGVVNHSIYGCTVTKGQKVMMRDLHNGINCDTAIVEFGGNDCDFFWKEIADKPDEIHLPRTPYDEFINKMRFMIGLLREHSIQPVLMTLVPLVPERFFEFLSRGLDRDNIMKWLHDIHRLYRWQEIYSNAIFRLAIDQDCLVVDMRTAFLQKADYQSLLCSDGIHPNMEGHLFMKNVIMELFEKNKII